MVARFPRDFFSTCVRSAIDSEPSEVGAAEMERPRPVAGGGPVGFTPAEQHGINSFLRDDSRDSLAFRCIEEPVDDVSLATLAGDPRVMQFALRLNF